MNTAIMLERIAESSPRLQARVAGYLYLLIIIGGLFAPFALAPSGMMLGDAALPTTARILAFKALVCSRWCRPADCVYMRCRRCADLL